VAMVVALDRVAAKDRLAVSHIKSNHQNLLQTIKTSYEACNKNLCKFQIFHYAVNWIDQEIIYAIVYALNLNVRASKM
jgi:hypothetical protein